MSGGAKARGAHGALLWGLWASGICLALVLVASPAGAQPAPEPPAAEAVTAAHTAATAQAEFDAGDFAAGLKRLNEQCRHKRADHPEYAQLLSKLAFFYESYAGDHRRVRSYVREIRRLKLPPDNPDVVAAKATLARIDALAATYRTEDAVLAKVRVTQYGQDKLQAQVTELEALVKRRPDYPGLAAAYHYLGESHLRLEQYRPAYQAFDRAMELRPAIGFSLPTPERRDRAFERWVRADLSVAAWVAMGLILALSALFFFSSKPWRHLGVKHAQLLLSLVVMWWLFLRASVWLLERSATHDSGGFPVPVYLYSSAGAPMSGVLDTLFAYGLVGVAGAFVLAVGTARKRPRWSWTFINAACVLCLFTSLMTQFYLRHSQATFKAGPSDRYAYLRGTLYYSLTQAQDPFILTTPMSYCGFQQTIREMDEALLEEWFGQFAEPCDAR